jgi:hypothetical protein
LAAAAKPPVLAKNTPKTQPLPSHVLPPFRNNTVPWASATNAVEAVEAATGTMSIPKTHTPNMTESANRKNLAETCVNSEMNTTDPRRTIYPPKVNTLPKQKLGKKLLHLFLSFFRLLRPSSKKV